MSANSNPQCEFLSVNLTSTNYVGQDCLPSPRRDTAAGSDDTSPARASTCSAMSGSSEDTSDSGFFQVLPNPDLLGSSPRPGRAERRGSHLTDCNDGEDIDFFLKVVSEFRDYVSDKIEELEEQVKANEEHLEILQKSLKSKEESWTKCEVDVTKEFNHLVGILHKEQSNMLENAKKQRAKSIDSLREKADVCRRNIKIISGVLCYARRVKNEKDDSIRENILKELKQRFNLASERELPSLEELSKSDEERHCRSKLNRIRISLEQAIAGMDSSPDVAQKESNEDNRAKELSTPSIIAPFSHCDITINSITVRMCTSANEEISNDVSCKFLHRGELVERNVPGVVGDYYVIGDLPPSCDVTIRLRSRSSEKTSQWSRPAVLRTLSQPAKFVFDSDTANSKLHLSADLNSVHYPGETPGKPPKSPGRFSFALNVLGNISFYTGKHYWEVLVNKHGWAVGVAYRTVPRNSWLGSNDSSWVLHFNPAKLEYKVRHAGEADNIRTKLLSGVPEISVVGIYIDYEAGIISFLDSGTKSVLYTYRVGAFSDPICAAVNPFYHGGVLTVITGLEVPNVKLIV